MSFDAFQSPYLSEMLRRAGERAAADRSALRRIALTVATACPDTFPRLEDEDVLYVIRRDALATLLGQANIDGWWHVEWLAFDKDLNLLADQPVYAPSTGDASQQLMRDGRLHALAENVWRELASTCRPLRTEAGREFFVFEEHTVGFVLERARRLAKDMPEFTRHD